MNKSDVMDNFHGTEVTDPFRWLENADSVETKKWTEEQHQNTEDYLNSFPDRKYIKQSITNRLNYEKYSLPQLIGDYYYFHKNSSLHNQPIFYRTKNLQDTELEIVFNPNLLSEEGIVALTNVTFSKDGKWMAYALSRNGSDGREIKVKNLETCEDYPDSLKLRRHSSIAWVEKNNGFYYSNYPILNGPANEEASYHNRVFWHQIGTSQEEDVLIFEDPEQKELAYEPFISNNNEYLLLRAHNGPQPVSRIYFTELEKANSFSRLFEDDKANYTFICNEGDLFYYLTSEGALNGRVVAINFKRPQKDNWIEIIPEQEETMVSVTKLHDYFIVSSMHNVNGKLSLYTMDGAFHKEVPLPDHVTVTGVGATKTKEEILVAYTSFFQPTQIMKYQINKNELSAIFTVEAPRINKSEYETKQVSYPSKDGTIIPMYLIHKKNIALKGNNPVLLSVYGGYKISKTPTFSPEIMTWLDAGGVYALANIRGGGEFGQKWHEGAILEKKQNTFDDAIFAVEWLIENNYTNSKKIAIIGRSNGGLVVGACIIQRPDLFGAALCLVPVTDMLRFHKFTFGRYWLNEFGNAELTADHFKFIYPYSPLHNVKKGTAYPPTFVTTADCDDRVVPIHAKKFTATLQEVQSGPNPIIYKEQKNAGHGEGKPTLKLIEEQTDLLTFLFKELDVELPRNENS
ncbi:prolyl oligopeptidase family serine peptidase [Bacillus sp. JJ1532]|uniref:prolyl oligopeptidase family serine peptidase n=1 Tax=Bacillus sp. JJ1532 TaxID=3122958 RepID=UPI003000955B